MTSDTTDSDPPTLDSAVVHSRPDAAGVAIEKSVVEAALDETDHGLIPDGRDQRASVELLDALVDAFTHPSASTPRDIAADCREAARTLRSLQRHAVRVHVVRRER